MKILKRLLLALGIGSAPTALNHANAVDQHIQTMREQYPDMTADEEGMLREQYPNVIFRIRFIQSSAGFANDGQA